MSGDPLEQEAKAARATMDAIDRWVRACPTCKRVEGEIAGILIGAVSGAVVATIVALLIP